MVRPELIRYLVGPVPVLSVSALFLIASLLLSWTAQNNESAGQWYSALLVVNIVGIAILFLFFLANLLRLVRQYRNRVIGSRLMVRFVMLFTVLTLLPIGVIYYFAGQFVSKGVDSWFDVKIEQALDDASLLGKSFLEASKQSLIDKAETDVGRLAFAQTDIDRIHMLEEIRNQRQYQEVALYEANGRIIASSNIESGVLVPDAPDDEDLRKAVAGSVNAKLEPFGKSLQYRVLAPVFSGGLAELPRVLQIRELLPLRHARLSESLQAAQTEYSRLNYLRRPLKISFLVSLSLITLMTTLISLWLALYAGRRLVAPIRDLAEGTAAVAAGDYKKRLPVKSEDEFGMLVSSFNTMTNKVRITQSLAQESQQNAEEQHAYLQTVLAHLSSGVMSFDSARLLQTSNAAVSTILGVDMDQYIGVNPRTIASKETRLVPLLDAIEAGLDQDGNISELEVNIEGSAGGQTLSVGITQIQQDSSVGTLDQTSGRPVSGESLGQFQIQKEGLAEGYVVVFDDVTKLIHAQREAAWGEVAQRLAHEIKNPLTPIQLSSERIRNKFLEVVPADQRDALDRSTRTISEQVDAMKRMVDAFSNYAKSTRLSLAEVNLNRLIEDVVHLYRKPDQLDEFELSLESSLPLLSADPDGLRQVLNNLIGNAHDATEDLEQAGVDVEINSNLASRTQSVGRKISIRTKLLRMNQIAGIEMRISDNGAGYPVSILERIFEPYVTTKTKGTGLGMAIVKRIVDRHQGRITVQNLDGSAEALVWLPIENASRTKLHHQ